MVYFCAIMPMERICRLERSREEYAAALELVRQIAKEAQKTREVVGSIREQHGHLERVKMEMDEVESHLREVVQQVADNRAYPWGSGAGP